MGVAGVCGETEVAENFFSHLKTSDVSPLSLRESSLGQDRGDEIYPGAGHHRRRPQSNNQGLSPTSALIRINSSID